MLRTVMIGSCVSIQGIFVQALENGLIRIKVDDREFDGRPVQARVN
ncbi:hypothetical protein [Litoreibacter janthinus]|uniref:Uncharacterized protein n=1 Tax=Litoreibacter janthinus TaxID=670154 RepID=A0A1I6G028_9RHOB|nr:hypothetical protein [Litoreibacter janthinus]SFR35532.1 hypothetical protein SAMN04488002_0656 [Litoreibacter janthinus]